MTDRTLTCCECNTEFVFTAAEQEFFREHGLTNDPKRCLECRKQRRRKSRARPRTAREDGDDKPAPKRRAAARGGTGGRTAPQREHHGDSATEHAGADDRPMHETSCSDCGIATKVPFVPDGKRPVFCLPCLKKQTR